MPVQLYGWPGAWKKNEMFRDWDASGYSIFNIDFLLNGYKRENLKCFCTSFLAQDCVSHHGTIYIG